MSEQIPVWTRGTRRHLLWSGALFLLAATACEKPMPTPPTNPGLVKALEGIRGTLTREAALHFYAELNQATLLLAQREGPAQPESGLTKEGALMEYLVVTGPDPPKGSC